MLMNKHLKEHLLDRLKKDIRYDKRKKEEFRDISIEYDVSSPAEGSAKVTLGDTVVMAGIKLSIDEPFPDTPDEGMIMVNAEFAAMASPEFEAGPPSMESIELARVIDRGIRESKTLEPQKLCIEKGEKVWCVSIDLIMVNDSGNLMDAAGIAALAALSNARFPAVLEDGTVDYKHKTEEHLPLAKKPIPVTVYKIEDQLLVDPLPEEENISSARLTVSFIDDGVICAMQKNGTSGLTSDEVDQMVQLASKRANEIREKL